MIAHNEPMSILCCYFENTLSISASTCTYSSPLLHNPRLPSVNRRTVATLLASGSQYWLSQNSQCSLVHDPWRMRTGSCSHTPLVHLLLSCPKLYLPYCLRSGGASSACSSAAAAVWSPPKDTGTPPPQQSFRIRRTNSLRFVQVDDTFLLCALGFCRLIVRRRDEKSKIFSSVYVVKKYLLTPAFGREGGNSGVMQWWVERKTSVVVNGGHCRMHCCSSSKWCR